MAYNPVNATVAYMQNLYTTNQAEWAIYSSARGQIQAYVRDFAPNIGSTIDVLLSGTGKVLRKPQMMAKLNVAQVTELFKTHNRILGMQFFVSDDQVTLIQHYVFFFWMLEARGVNVATFDIGTITVAGLTQAGIQLDEVTRIRTNPCTTDIPSYPRTQTCVKFLGWMTVLQTRLAGTVGAYGITMEYLLLPRDNPDLTSPQNLRMSLVPRIGPKFEADSRTLFRIISTALSDSTYGLKVQNLTATQDGYELYQTIYATEQGEGGIMAAVQALEPLHEAVYTGKGKPYFLEWSAGQLNYFAALVRNSFTWPAAMMTKHLYSKIKVDPSHSQLIALVAVEYRTHLDDPDEFIRQVYAHIQTFKIEMNAVSKYSRASQLDTARQDGGGELLTFQGVDLSGHVNDRGQIIIPRHMFLEYRKTNPKLVEEVIAYNRDKRGYKDDRPRDNKRRRGGKMEREVKKLKARIQELTSDATEPAQDGENGDEESDKTPDTGTKKKGAGAGRGFRRDAP